MLTTRKIRQTNCRWAETLGSIALAFLMYILDITPPYVKVIETGEPYENLPKFGLIVDASLWILAMICQLLTRIYTKMKFPLQQNQTSNELFSNTSLAVCIVTRFIPLIVSALKFHRNVIQSTYLCGKILFVPFQILCSHSKAREFFLNKHPMLMKIYQKFPVFESNQIHPQHNA